MKEYFDICTAQTALRAAIFQSTQITMFEALYYIGIVFLNILAALPSRSTVASLSLSPCSNTHTHETHVVVTFLENV